MGSHKATLDRLRARGMRITKVRQELIHYILGLKDHWSIQDLAEKIQKDLPGVGIATVYRTVNLLTEEGAITRSLLEHGPARFEVTPKDHHDHLVCTRCDKIIEFENDEIERLQEKVAAEHGFVLTDHRMELFGLCKTCKRAENKTK